MRVHSNDGDLVLDPFMGSGTTALSALNTGRNYVGFELNKKYFDILSDRIADYTGKPLVKITSDETIDEAQDDQIATSQQSILQFAE